MKRRTFKSHGKFQNEGVNLDSPRLPALQPRTENQRRMVNAILHMEVIAVTGVAGTGKTFIAASLAAEALMSGRIQQIILTRPAVEVEPMGFLKGTLEEKFHPYLEPFAKTLKAKLGGKYHYELGRAIIPSPLAYMRGADFQDSWVLLDEAQNTSPRQMEMLLTRIGCGSKVILTGDTKQKDVMGLSGLEDAVRRLSGDPGFAHIEMGLDDVVRSPLVKRIIEAYMVP